MDQTRSQERGDPQATSRSLNPVAFWELGKGPPFLQVDATL